MTARLCPELPLPSYTYVSGQHPHPLSDPSGHHFAGLQMTVDQERLRADDWRSCLAYCYALDLFQAGYYWEAHEMWERSWHAAGRQGTLADFLKGLIKLAAAGVKAREARRVGVIRHAQRAAELWRDVLSAADDEWLAGLHLATLVLHAERVATHAERIVASARCGASEERRIFSFDLSPQ